MHRTENRPGCKGIRCLDGFSGDADLTDYMNRRTGKWPESEGRTGTELTILKSHEDACTFSNAAVLIEPGYLRVRPHIDGLNAIGRNILYASQVTQVSNPRSAAMAYLSSLSDKEFAEFFYEATRGRVTSDLKKWQGHFLLADAERVEDAWDVELIAIPDSREYGGAWSDDAPICQSGTCGTCRQGVRSWAKHALCPVCGNGVYCT